MNPALATKALNAVAVYSALTKKALDELTVHRASQQKAASLRPELLGRMVEVGAVGEHQKQAAEAMLGSHAETLGLLKMAVERIARLNEQLQKRASTLGESVDPKEAGVSSEKTAGEYDSMKDPFVGRKTSQKKASDLAILRVLEAPGS